MKTIAKNEYESLEVLKNLTVEQMIERLTSLYSDEEIMEIIGYHDESNEDVNHLYSLEEDSPEFLNALYVAAINNGNFEDAIAMNKRVEL